ncbi:GntR family transcriptional regulator [Streptomyces sp. A3M-1-3]|uniref:GntR family transcriptional regulator n=1 Tax=Streptomyces sp. A3M-1-3 TaxID=2962044 RepID=UPI0020B9004E|nr:GntR family transcriptional regulator [Streptomyces sp. A3M-1-3]MCP3822368.1 GntR family transcriptional regulator [Streptomyces sp. A3M-1-3]
MLPLDDAIGTGYRVSRNTVRQALGLLRAEQLIDRLPGVGTGRIMLSPRCPAGIGECGPPSQPVAPPCEGAPAGLAW